MKAGSTLALLGCVALAAACNSADNAQRGGAREEQLVLATVAGDEGKVREILAAGADPNKMAPFEGHYQSAWKLALNKARPDQPNFTAIIRDMIAAHANPEVAWGEGPSRRGGYSSQPEEPILDVRFNDATDAVRALLEGGLKPSRAELALVLAVENRQFDIVRLLVEAGVDVNSQRSANTPLVAAIENRDVAMMTYLEDHGAREKP